MELPEATRPCVFQTSSRVVMPLQANPDPSEPSFLRTAGNCRSLQTDRSLPSRGTSPYAHRREESEAQAVASPFPLSFSSADGEVFVSFTTGADAPLFLGCRSCYVLRSYRPTRFCRVFSSPVLGSMEIKSLGVSTKCTQPLGSTGVVGVRGIEKVRAGSGFVDLRGPVSRSPGLLGPVLLLDRSAPGNLRGFAPASRPFCAVRSHNAAPLRRDGPICHLNPSVWEKRSETRNDLAESVKSKYASVRFDIEVCSMSDSRSRPTQGGFVYFATSDRRLSRQNPRIFSSLN